MSSSLIEHLYHTSNGSPLLVYSGTTAGAKRTHEQSYLQQNDQYYHINEFFTATPSKAQKLSCSYTAAEFTDTITSPLSTTSSETSTNIDMAELSPLYHHAPACNKGGDLLTEEKTLKKEQTSCGFTLIITDEPEENYRARYESEGCRGPMKGRNGGCPSVMLTYQRGVPPLSAHVSVELTNSDGTQLQSCRLDSTDDGQNLLKKLQLTDKTPFDNLRIRRLKKTDPLSKGASSTGSVKSAGGGKGRTKQDEKQAHLMFTAQINIDGKQQITLKALSQPIFLNANHDPPDIHRIVPQYGTTGDSIAIIGTRMHSPRVTFIYTDTHTGREQEVPADYEKEISHQNALVVKVPQMPHVAFTSSSPLAMTTHIRVTAGKGDRTGREPLRSNLSPFTYIKQGPCKECSFKQSIPAPPPPTTTTPYPPAIYTQYCMRAHPMPSSVIVSATSNISPVHRTPPTSVPPTPSGRGDVVDDILEGLCDDPLISPPPHTNSPYNNYNTASPVRYPTPQIIPQATMEGIRMDQPKPEELDCYFPGHSPPQSFSTPLPPPTTSTGYRLSSLRGYPQNS